MRSTDFMDSLRGSGPVRSVELRPPPAGLPRDRSVDAWIDLNRAVRTLLEDGRYVLFTDDAVGSREEESLQHLTANLGPKADLSRIVPFLTCKHSLDYCLLFARRAVSHGIPALTVTGGDSAVGPPRCVPRSRDLRALIKERLPGLALGAWVNPYRSAQEQVSLLQDPDHHADYFLTQIVSHHDLEPVDSFLEEAARSGLEVPGMFGVFYYRSARRETLTRLSHFIPVPVEELVQEFEAGAGPEEVCVRTLEALSERGVDKVYISNLDLGRLGPTVREIERRL